MTAWSGSDGVFNTISLDGKTVYQGQNLGGGNYTELMYFKRPAAGGQALLAGGERSFPGSALA
ncbi:hypothetical protein F0U62_36235 [Cystobacter fuscus]|uniref:hypothetical protein n=1 Tax=Cystobacter fuscus TaxID=43 RepID=UPI002B28CAE3|nr:hypothetical protein F0U62_36235 [Cystobacter fuscus]